MKSRSCLRVAMAQMNSTVGDLWGNAEKISNFISRAKELQADLVTFPELVICGYPPEDLLLKSHFVRDNLKALNTVISSTKDITAVVGFVDKDEQGQIFNAAAIINNKELKGVYHKMELPNYGVFDEKRYFQRGKEFFLFKLGNVSFGVSICEDIWKDKGAANLEAESGAKLLINLSASPYHAGKRRVREKLLIKRAKETDSFICYTNLVGGQDELVFDGGSLVIDSEGEIIACGKQFQEDFVIADLDIDLILKSKPNFKRKAGVKSVISFPRNIAKKSTLAKEQSLKRLTPLEEIYSALVLGTRDYVSKNGFQKVVIGLSGGIDSSLTAVIACDALGKDNIIGVSMPSYYSSEATKSDTRILSENLGIRLIVIPINAIFKVYLMALEKEFAGLRRDVTEENLQARIRGNILMALSNKFGYLVLTTGNKSEISCGYCTLYGDMAGGFNILKDVPKTLVYKLSKFRNKKEGRELIPDSIIIREPSAELRPDQKDKDTLPPYSILDPILKSYIEENKSYEEIITEGKLDPDLTKKVIQMIDRNEYKRRQSCPGIKITPKAFGKDRRMPITNRYREF
ncbi:NAD+ synthase [Candidatus Aerophobetes bacterium]|nr:NAD+ synthase [Candidatus Aerophobetes bacterium]